MSSKHLIQVLGRTEDSVIADTTDWVNTSNTLMAMLKTQMQRQMRVSISSSVALDGGSVADVFTVTGGYCMIYSMVMFLTEAVSANACTMAWSFDPTTGASDIPIGSALSFNGYAIGDMVWAEGDATALVKADQATNSARACTVPILAPVGGIDMDMQNSDPTTGIADWIIQYRPLTADAYIVAN